MPSAAVLALMLASAVVCALAANGNSSSETADSDLRIHNVTEEDEYDDHQNDISEELEYQIYEIDDPRWDILIMRTAENCCNQSPSEARGLRYRKWPFAKD